MNRRIVTRLVCTLAAAAALGCSEDYNFTEPVVPFDITPTFTSVDEGATTTVQAALNGAPVDVTWSSDDVTIATVSSTGVVTGLKGGTTSIIAKLNADPTKARSTSITVIPVPELVNGVARTVSSSAARGTFQFFKVIVPAGKTLLKIQMSGGTGDADLYVRLGSKPTGGAADICRSENAANNELCEITNPAAGTYFVGLAVWDAYSGASLRATVTP